MADVIPPGQVLRPEAPEEEPEVPRQRQKQSSERFETLNTFVDETMRSLSHADSLVWLVLWRVARHGAARASYGDIAARIGCHRSTVTKSLRRLRQQGLVEVIHRGDQHRGPSVYRLRDRARVGA